MDTNSPSHQQHPHTVGHSVDLRKFDRFGRPIDRAPPNDSSVEPISNREERELAALAGYGYSSDISPPTSDTEGNDSGLVSVDSGIKGIKIEKMGDVSISDPATQSTMLHSASPPDSAESSSYHTAVVTQPLTTTKTLEPVSSARLTARHWHPHQLDMPNPYPRVYSPQNEEIYRDAFELTSALRAGRMAIPGPVASSAGATKEPPLPVATITIQAVNILREASTEMLDLLGQKTTPEREHKMLVALGTIQTCLDAHTALQIPTSRPTLGATGSKTSHRFGKVLDGMSDVLVAGAAMSHENSALAAGISGDDPLVPSLPRSIGIEVLQARLDADGAETLELQRKLKVVNEDRITAREEVDRLLGAYHQERRNHEAVRRELKKADQRMKAMKQETESSTASHEKEMSRLKAQYKGNHKALKKEKKGLRTKIMNIARSARQDAVTPAVIKVQNDLAGRKRRLRKQQSEIDRQRSSLQQARKEQVPLAKEHVAQSQGGKSSKIAAKLAEAARVASKASTHTTGSKKKNGKGIVLGQ